MTDEQYSILKKNGFQMYFLKTISSLENPNFINTISISERELNMNSSAESLSDLIRVRIEVGEESLQNRD